MLFLLTSNKEAVFIFTRDRPEILSKTLDSIRSLRYLRYVVDDSTKPKNQQRVLELCNCDPNFIFVGRTEFNQFIKQHHIDFPSFDFLLREFGHSEWNLVYARNFALLYAKSLGFEKVLFMDDDILVPNLGLIEELFLSIDNYQFVGANVVGLVDDSILGHIATDLSIVNDRMLSGGFMAYKLAYRQLRDIPCKDLATSFR